MCSSLWFHIRERPEKWCKELYGAGPQFDRHEYIHMNLLVYNSGQHTYVTGLFNFFFVLQDLIDRIDSYSRE